MSKKSAPRRLSEHEASASLRNLRIAPQKLNLIAQMIRGKSIEKAIEDLVLCRKRAARHVYKLLMSAVANAETNHALDVDDLFIWDVCVGKGVYLKRFMPRARGRGSRILKKSSWINVVLRTSKGFV